MKTQEPADNSAGRPGAIGPSRRTRAEHAAKRIEAACRKLAAAGARPSSDAVAPIGGISAAALKRLGGAAIKRSAHEFYDAETKR